MVFGCLGVKDSKKRRGRWRCVIAVDFQTMVRLNGWRGMGVRTLMHHYYYFERALFSVADDTRTP
jgi:hypothetical protein